MYVLQVIHPEHSLYGLRVFACEAPGNCLKSSEYNRMAHREQVMTSSSLSLIAFVFIFGGAAVGMLLRRALPISHLRDDSRDVIKLATGLVGTMSALVLGLLVASAKGFYDAQTSEITQISADIVFLDRGLALRPGDQGSTRGIVQYDSENPRSDMVEEPLRDFPIGAHFRRGK